MTNEELAELIQRTDSKEAKAILWEQNRGLICRFAKAYFKRYGSVAYTVEDLIQQGYFALLYAVKSYKRDRGYLFTSYLKYAYKNSIRGLVDTDTHLSLDVSTAGTGGDEKEVALIDTIPDDTALDELEQAINLTADQQAVYTALSRLPTPQRSLIVDLYYRDETLTSIAKREARTVEAIRSRRERAFERLRKDRDLVALYKDMSQSETLQSLYRVAERPDRVASRRTLQSILRRSGYSFSLLLEAIENKNRDL